MISAQPNTLITLSYNSRRQRSTLSDPNYGLMQTTYNAFGELIHQTTPRGFETTYTYDKLGRTTSRIENEGTTTWHYSTTPGFLGTLQRIEGLGQITSYTYDELLRPETVVENINNQDYTTTYTYDHLGRPETITHPSGFAEQNTYNNHGYLKKISNADDQSLLWEAQAYYAPGMLHESATGNGLLTRNQYEPETLRLTGSFVYNAAQERVQDFEYKYDKLGNMQHRIKWLSRANNQFLKEEFWYDDLNRLTDIKLNGQTTGGQTYDNSGLGNITAKTANGQQIYSNAEYGEGNHGPHAISSATTTANVFPADPQTAEYTSYEQLKSLSQGELGLSIMYGHHHQRIRQKYWDEETHFVSLKLWAGACEYITKNGQTTTLTYLSGPGGLYALHLINPDESESIRYIHTDHLGSWTAVSDDTGTIINEQSYDACSVKLGFWECSEPKGLVEPIPPEARMREGNRRSPSTWTKAGMAVQSPLFDRGFTGHEHLDGFQLINMNGRMYDPVVSRMLAPDNFVQTPDFSQNFNRYSYALNNPLMFTDPSGETFMAPFFLMAMVADFTSNLINGYHDPLGSAYKNVSSTISGINNAVQVPIYQSNNTSITVGLDPFNLGVSMNASFRSGNVTQSFHAGFGFLGSSFGTSTTLNIGDFSFSVGGGYNGGWTNLTSKNPQFISGYQAFGGASYYDRNRDQQFSFGLSSFYGSHPQKNWFVGYGRGDFSFAMTNDAFRGSDWYRTAAAEIGIGEVSFGFNLFTTEPPLEEYDSKPHKGGNSEYISPIHGKNPLGTYSTGSRVYAGMYLGYRNGNRVSRAGIDAPWVQDLFQNGIHRWVVPTPYFNTNYGSPSVPFLQGGYVNPFSLYTF